MRTITIALLVLCILYIGACTATSGNDDAPLEHQWSLDLPHSPERLWALMQDYSK